MHAFCRLFVVVVAIAPIGARSACGENWPQFRGPSGMGLVTERGLPTTWGKEGENVLWKASLPGTDANGKPDQNQSSPVVFGDRVYLTVSFWPEGTATSEYPEHHVACYGVSDGARLWDVKLDPGPWKLSDLRGGYTAPTPACDGERLYVVFGSAFIAALDLEGKLVWRHDLPDYAAFDVAVAASPVVYGSNVLLLSDKGGQKSTLTAYDGKSGEIRWEQKRPKVGFAHCTPTIARINGKQQLLVSASNALQGLDPDNGDVVWWVKTPGDVCSPVLVGNEFVFADTGRGGPGVLVQPGEGDVTETAIQWKIPQIPEGLSSPVVSGDYLYRLHNPGILKCIETKTGKEAFAVRLNGVSTSSSPIATPEGYVYFPSSGKSFVVKAGPEYDLRETNDLGDPSPASVAVSNGRLFFKGRTHLHCVGTKP